MVAWYRRSPVFYLPLGWFGPAERVLALPFAERGKKLEFQDRLDGSNDDAYS